MAKPITISIHGDASHLERTLNNTQNRLGTFGVAVGSFFGNVAANAVGALPGVASDLFDLGTELAGFEQKFGTVFSTAGSAKAVQDWAQATAHDMGLTRREAQGLAVNMADLLKPMGFTAEAAADMSTETLNLAGALSEWSGGQYDAAQVSDILTKAMLGERDQLKALGISINQAEVDQRAMAIAQAEGRDEITQMDKALATQQLILEKSTDAQAAYAEGGNELQRNAARTRAKFNELKESVARGLLPVFLAVADFVTTRLIPAVEMIARRVGPLIEQFVAWFREDILPTVQDVMADLQAVTETVLGAIEKFWDTFGDTILASIEVTWDTIRGVFEGAFQVIQGLFDVFVAVFTGDWDRAWDGIKSILSGTLDAAVALITDLPRRILEVGPALLDAGAGIIGDLFQGMLDAVGAGVGFAADFAATLGNAVKEFINTQIIDRINREGRFAASLGLCAKPIADRYSTRHAED